MKNISCLLDKKVLEINGINPIITFEGQYYLTIECFWRILHKGYVVLSISKFEQSQDHRLMVDKLKNFFYNTRVVSATTKMLPSDLLITFDNGFELELLVDSEIYENWTISGDDKTLIVSLPGGELMGI
ncbi:DUF6188 family protein [Fusibacter ferrireducens]|uniref:Uncharacterized protein n=1 Tax=Fusibacter ferrireducens TaxID=2785058 RepID=A0ABS0A016_9FIRM|nr:DUF6188 family protein [Fusibacter ferrireducens]MBF4696043.1 hypothetical protein [Fusibacter ferrireducens]